MSIGTSCMSISNVTTLASKQQSTMFFDANIWRLDSNQLKNILDKHFRVISSYDVEERLQDISMKDDIWQPDLKELA